MSHEPWAVNNARPWTDVVFCHHLPLHDVSWNVDGSRSRATNRDCKQGCEAKPPNNKFGTFCQLQLSSGFELLRPQAAIVHC